MIHAIFSAYFVQSPEPSLRVFQRDADVQELVAVTSPYADAIPLCANAGTPSGVRRSKSDTSSSGVESSTHSDVLKFIQQHYNSGVHTIMPFVPATSALAPGLTCVIQLSKSGSWPQIAM